MAGLITGVHFAADDHEIVSESSQIIPYLPMSIKSSTSSSQRLGILTPTPIMIIITVLLPPNPVI